MTGLTVKRKNAICLLLQGWKIADVSRELNVSERQLYRWLQEPEFSGELSHQQGLVINAVSWRLVSLSNQAVTVLGDILDSDTPPPGSNIKRLAAVAVLELLLKFKELRDFEERLSRLEEMTGNR